MTNTIEELCRKDVINVENAQRLGVIGDVEADVCSGCLTAILVFPRGGLLRPPQPIRVPWGDIVMIGEETVLVKNVPMQSPPKRGGKLFGVLGK